MRHLALPLALAVGLTGCVEEWGMDQHGRPVAGDAFEGQWLVVNYWAEWCGPCRTEIPELNRLDETREDVAVVGVNFDELQGAALHEAAEALGIRFRVLADNPAERLGLPPINGLPMTFLVDEEGRVREQLMGEQTAEGLSARLAQLQAR